MTSGCYMAAWNIIQIRTPGQTASLPVIHATPALAGPNYPALIEVVMRLRKLPDGLSESRLYKPEAAEIRACGIEARAGWKRPWRCPLLPHALLWPYPALYHLSDGVERLWQPVYLGWAKERARPIRIAPMDRYRQTNPQRGSHGRTDSEAPITTEALAASGHSFQSRSPSADCRSAADVTRRLPCCSMISENGSICEARKARKSQSAHAFR